MNRKRWFNSRVIAKAGIFLLLGAIVNVAVAWAFALCDRERSSVGAMGGHQRPGFWFKTGIIESRCLDVPGEFWACQKPKRWAGIPLLGTWWRGPNAESEMRRHFPSWSLFLKGDPIELLTEAGAPSDIDYNERATGWPMLSFRYTCIDEYTGTGQFKRFSSDGLVRLPWVPEGWRNDVPIRPSWPGFAVNTVLSAALLLIVSAAFSTLRHAWRTCRGECSACGYNLRGNVSGVCPECGGGAIHGARS